MKYLIYLTTFLVLLCMLSACGNSQSASTGRTPRVVKVTETDFRIRASLTSFRPGQTYRSVVTNQGLVAHEFMLLPLSSARTQAMSMAAMDRTALVTIPLLAPGETRTLDYTFASTPSASQLEIACYLPGHYEAGMRLSVRVSAST